MRFILRRYFQMADCEVVEASSIDEALAMKGVHPAFVLITLDLNLGAGGEVATLDRIEDLKAAWPEALVMVLTGVVDASEESRVLEAGAHAMLLKRDTPEDGNILIRMGRKLRELAAGTGPSQINLAVAEVLAARFSQYVRHQGEAKA